MKKAYTTVLVVCFLPAVASAHSFVRYVSTPITPPQEFIWWLPISLALLVVGSFVILWRLLDRHWLAAIGLSLATITLFSIFFFLFGCFSSVMTTAPLPGLGTPHPTFWGMGWSRVGWLFILWNFFGYLFLLGSLRLCAGIHRTKPRLKKLARLTLALYMIVLIPYVATGALVHGWAGGYVHRGCVQRLKVINIALADYADQHGGRLPSADGLILLLNELKPYLSEEYSRYLGPIDVCPLGAAYERDPKHYEWNTAFSGKKLSDIDIDQFYDDVIPVSCPYHRGGGSLASSELRRRILEAEFEEDPNKAIDDD